MRQSRIFFVIFLASITLTGCFNLDKYDKVILDKNQELSNRAQDRVGEKVEEGKQKVKEYTKQQIKEIASSLTDEAKTSIDNWLAENSLNKYGDTKDSMYIGGTPLFDEATGEARDRFEYILENNPELVEQLNLN